MGLYDIWRAKYNRLHTMAIIIDINIQDVYRIIGQYPDSVILIYSTIWLQAIRNWFITVEYEENNRLWLINIFRILYEHLAILL